MGWARTAPSPRESWLQRNMRIQYIYGGTNFAWGQKFQNQRFFVGTCDAPWAETRGKIFSSNSRGNVKIYTAVREALPQEIQISLVHRIQWFCWMGKMKFQVLLKNIESAYPRAQRARGRRKGASRNSEQRPRARCPSPGWSYQAALFGCIPKKKVG